METQTDTVEEHPCHISCTADEITLADFITLVHTNAKLHGFWDGETRNTGEMIALIHSELSEALEAMRHGDPPDPHCPEYTNAEIEFADAVIRIFDTCVGSESDIGNALIAKHNFNCQRPYKHGKEF